MQLEQLLQLLQEPVQLEQELHPPQPPQLPHPPQPAQLPQLEQPAQPEQVEQVPQVEQVEHVEQVEQVEHVEQVEQVEHVEQVVQLLQQLLQLLQLESDASLKANPRIEAGALMSLRSNEPEAVGAAESAAFSIGIATRRETSEVILIWGNTPTISSA